MEIAWILPPFTERDEIAWYYVEYCKWQEIEFPAFIIHLFLYLRFISTRQQKRNGSINWSLSPTLVEWNKNHHFYVAEWHVCSMYKIKTKIRTSFVIVYHVIEFSITCPCPVYELLTLLVIKYGSIKNYLCDLSDYVNWWHLTNDNW